MNRAYWVAVLLFIFSVSSLSIPTISRLQSSSAGSTPFKPSVMQSAKTPSGESPFVRGEFYPNMATLPNSFMTVDEGGSNMLEFRASANMTISNVVLNMTVPAPFLSHMGGTYFSGEITVGSPARLLVNLTAVMPTETIISVVAYGDVTVNGSPYRFREPFNFMVNTTDWDSIIHSTPPDGDPYGSNATFAPAANLTGMTLMASQLSQISANPRIPPTPEFTPFTLTGTFIYFDNEWGGFLPAHHVKVEVYYDGFCVCDHFRGRAYTDDFGKFTIYGVDATDWRVSVFPEDDVAKVGPGCKLGNCDFEYYEVILFRHHAEPSGSSINIGVWAPQGFNEAFAIHNYLLDAPRRLSNYGFTQTWRQYAVFDANGQFTPHTDTPPELPLQVIWFPSLMNPWPKSTWGPATVYHEYGHALMEASYGSLNYPCAPFCNANHNMETSSNPGFAISEGWGEFMAALIFNSPTCNGCTNFPQDKFGNDETNSWLANSNPPTSNGNIVEGSIASVFWDLQDTTVSESYKTGGYDKVQGLLSFLIGTDKDDNSAEFHSAHRNNMLDVFTDIQNGIAYYQTNLGIKDLCAVFVGNGLMPSQCQGVVLPVFGFASILSVAAAAISSLVFWKRRSITIGLR